VRELHRYVVPAAPKDHTLSKSALQLKHRGFLPWNWLAEF
jgi:hypothetical protein